MCYRYIQEKAEIKNTSFKVEEDLNDISPFESGSSSTEESSCKLLFIQLNIHMSSKGRSEVQRRI
jgi:hypothetical protein